MKERNPALHPLLKLEAISRTCSDTGSFYPSCRL